MKHNPLVLHKCKNEECLANYLIGAADLASGKEGCPACSGDPYWINDVGIDVDDGVEFNMQVAVSGKFHPMSPENLKQQGITDTEILSGYMEGSFTKPDVNGGSEIARLTLAD